MPGIGAFATHWWMPVLYIVVMGHITNLCVTLYLHRSATHEGVKFHPVVENAMRFWLWLTTGMKTREWVAVHRKHHAFSDRPGDPHSPVNEGLLEITCGGVFFYRDTARDKETLDKYGKGCPDDWMERNIYTPRPFMGLLSMMAVDVLLFGIGWGLIAWTCMAVWIPIFGNVINGIGHAIGYRNFETKDSSRNIIPLGLWIVGEELHNNHHADPKSAKFKAKWYEFDIGWMYISLLKTFRLANVIYARNVSAKEFKAKYYGKATTAAAEVGASATAAARAVEGAARRAQVVASEAVTEAARRAQIAGAAITAPQQDAIAE